MILHTLRSARFQRGTLRDGCGDFPRYRREGGDYYRRLIARSSTSKATVKNVMVSIMHCVTVMSYLPSLSNAMPLAIPTVL